VNLPVIARQAKTLTGVNYALMLTYRGEIFLWAIVTALPLIMMGLWVEAGRSGEFALSATDLARYFVVVFFIRQFTVVWVIYEFEFHVVTGRLTPLLLRPLDPMWHYLALHHGEQLARLPFVALLVFVAGFIFPEAFLGSAEQPGVWLPELWRIAVFALLLPLVFILRFLIAYCLSMLAFWMERVTAFEGLNYLLYLFLSGMVAPLEEFEPQVIKEIVLWTPFPYMVWFPAQVLVGGAPVDIPRGVAILVGWIVALWLLSRWLWRRGLKRYSAMGA